MVKPKGMRGRGEAGFTFMEVLVGLCLLSLVVAGLSAYSIGQRNGLYKSSQLSDATQAAASALETMKSRLSDSATFMDWYTDAEFHPRVAVEKKKINNQLYAVTLTVSRAPEPLYAVRIRARAAWKYTHAVELGVLFPGKSETL